MKLWKKPSLLLLVISSCFVLFGSCGTNTTSSPATPTPSGRTPTARSTALPTLQPTSSSSTCGAWSKVSSPNVGTSTNALHGVAAISTNEVWAVGSSSNGQSSLTLVEHWNGTEWNVVASPNVEGLTSDGLSGVAAIASNDIWAVGSYGNGQSSSTLVEHWNGTQWSIVSSPNIASLGNSLAAITAVSANDIWAVGNASGANGSQSLIEHWNGTTWSIVTSPSPGNLDGVAAVSAKDVWAVGTMPPGLTLIEHWNGTQWSVVSSPNPSHIFDTLNAIVKVTDSDIWAAGDYSDEPGDPNSGYLPLIEHWNGTQWSIVKSPMQGESDLVNGIASISSKNITVVGDYRTTTDVYSPYDTLVEHWNGAQWSVVNSPSPDSFNYLLAAVRVPATSSIWAVGYTEDLNSGQNYVEQTLTEFHC